MSMMVSFVLSFFPRDVLDEILNLIESVLRIFLPTLRNVIKNPHYYLSVFFTNVLWLVKNENASSHFGRKRFVLPC